MKIAVLLSCMLLFNVVYADTGDIDVTIKYREQFDFSTILMPKTRFLGYIGSDYQRLKIEFLDISKSATKPDVYLLKGTSVVKENKSNFSGTIKIEKIIQLATMHYGVDDSLKESGIKAEGTLIGSYELKETQKQKYSGVFKGKVTLSWYVDKNGDLRYDDIQNYSDSYANNQYEGKWTAYGSKKQKTANWGEFRIPNSGDLDIGSGDFAPNPKYLQRGWMEKTL